MQLTIFELLLVTCKHVCRMLVTAGIIYLYSDEIHYPRIFVAPGSNAIFDLNLVWEREMFTGLGLGSNFDGVIVKRPNIYSEVLRMKICFDSQWHEEIYFGNGYKCT